MFYHHFSPFLLLKCCFHCQKCSLFSHRLMFGIFSEVYENIWWIRQQTIIFWDIKVVGRTGNVSHVHRITCILIHSYRCFSIASSPFDHVNKTHRQYFIDAIIINIQLFCVCMWCVRGLFVVFNEQKPIAFHTVSVNVMKITLFSYILYPFDPIFFFFFVFAHSYRK